MILPIAIYGHPVLRQKARNVLPDEPGLQALVDNMLETMYHAHGVGLAAPQVAQPLRLFVIDGKPMHDMVDTDAEAAFLTSFQRVVINPVIESESGPQWGFEEGCLSIPGVREVVMRHPVIQVRYLDRNLQPVQETLNGIAARIFQHEYDHIEGVMFPDHLSAFKKQVLRGKLARMMRRGAEADYPTLPGGRS